MGREKKLHEWTQEQKFLEQEAKEKAEWAALDEAAAAAAEARKPERYEDWLAAQQKKEAALNEPRRPRQPLRCAHKAVRYKLSY